MSRIPPLFLSQISRRIHERCLREREIKVPGMDARPEVLNAALAQNEAHEEYGKALYRAVSQNFSTGFAGRMFRQNLIDNKTAELGNAMREQQAAVKRKRLEET